jgi:hypothetical protein
MSLIPMNELQQLKVASAVKTVAASAEADQQEHAIAYLINTAANCGQYDVTYNGRLIDSVKTKLENQGYTITFDIAVMNSEDIAHISWK